ncbi:fungal-specific transcription factor domain-containing protein [Aspergillus carlsbadensis]|nr:fungal-specific transcription factor domain-containing protein [Aspergillus carlsbadensis]
MSLEPVLHRAKVACKACNARRVKCDAGSGQPCWNCRVRHTPCDLIESRRGKELSQPPQSQEEDSTLTYTIEVDYTPKDGRTERRKVHYPIPPSVADRYISQSGSRREEPISLAEALTLPRRHIADQLIHAFFERVHPAYPVFDRNKFSKLYHEGQASPLVLQTIFFLGFTVGSDKLIHEAGYSTRFEARKTHYLHAKLLYDIDYDLDPLNVVATLLMFGFWWRGPEDQKGTCFWVGCAVNVALEMGMHRSSSLSGLSPGVQSLRKRIWWAVYTRDRHTAAAFGQPCRIRDEDCDIEPLTEDDLTFDLRYDENIIPQHEAFHVSYVLEMSKLVIILGDILIAEFSPRRALADKYSTSSLASRLAEWEAQLPQELRRLQLDSSLGAPFWAAMLHMSYHNYYILLYRPRTIETNAASDIERDSLARGAADSITRIAEDLIATGTIRAGQIHLLPALFGALSIHTIAICRKEPVRQKLAENKSRQCLLALSELSASWPVRIWFARGFLNLMRRLTGRGGSGAIVNVSSSIAGSQSDTVASLGAGLPEALSPAGPSLSHGAGVVDSNTQPASFDDSRRPDQLLYDSFVAGYLDNSFDPDLELYNTLGPMLPITLNNAFETGGADFL